MHPDLLEPVGVARAHAAAAAGVRAAHELGGISAPDGRVRGTETGRRFTGHVRWRYAALAAGIAALVAGLAVWSRFAHAMN